MEAAETVKLPGPILTAVEAKATDPVSVRRPNPRSYEHSQTYPDKDAWTAALNDEVNSLVDKGVFEPGDPPVGPEAEGMQITTLGGIMDLKYKWNGNTECSTDVSLDKRKGRYVARGDHQDWSSYDETYAPAVQPVSIRIFLTLTLILGLEGHHFDVKSAFLNSPMDKYNIWIKLPEAYEAPGGFKYAKLKKSIYGLKQAAHDWNVLQEDWLMNYDDRFCKSEIDPCLYYINDEKTGLKFFALVQVDDYMVATNDDSYYQAFTKAYFKRFAADDKGPISQVMGMNLEWSDSKVGINQTRQILDLLADYGLQDCNGTQTPMRPDLDLEPARVCDTKLPYRQLLGSLLWIGRCTRPDIMYSVIYMSQFCNAYDETHYGELRRILRYLKYTLHDRFVIAPDLAVSGLMIDQWSDSDYARHKLDRKSFSGSLTAINGTVVNWCTKKQSILATSPCEAEYTAACEACKDDLFPYHMVEDIFSKNKSDKDMLHKTMNLHVDNNGAISMMKNPLNSKASRHYSVRVHAVRDWVRRGYYRPGYVSSGDNKADGFTKPLGRVDFRKHRRRVGMCSDFKA